MLKHKILQALIFFFTLLFSAAPASASPSKGAGTPGPASAPSMQLDAGDSLALSGKVVETMNAGGYSYVCIEKKGKKTWVAVPEMKVVVGQVMSFQPGQEMTNFSSKSLNRTFDTIVFSGGLAGPGDASPALPAGHPPTSGSQASSAPQEKDIKKVEKAAGPNAYTVAEVYAKAKSLNKKKVSVRAQVVKVSAGIMGKNWIHLQDGSGDAAKGTHDLVITTQDLPSAGDIVTIKGTVYKDKDFGGGYKYAVIIENAAIK